MCLEQVVKQLFQTFTSYSNKMPNKRDGILFISVFLLNRPVLSEEKKTFSLCLSSSLSNVTHLLKKIWLNVGVRDLASSLEHTHSHTPIHTHTHNERDGG